MEIKGKFSVTADAETKVSRNGNEYVSVRVAYNERVKGEDGQWGPLRWEDAKNDYDTVAEFYDVTLFPTTAGFEIAKSLVKGDFIEIDGRRNIRGYIKDGERRTAQSIVASSVARVGSRKKELASAGTPF